MHPSCDAPELRNCGDSRGDKRVFFELIRKSVISTKSSTRRLPGDRHQHCPNGAIVLRSMLVRWKLVEAETRRQLYSGSEISRPACSPGEAALICEVLIKSPHNSLELLVWRATSLQLDTYGFRCRSFRKSESEKDQSQKGNAQEIAQLPIFSAEGISKIRQR